MGMTIDKGEIMKATKENVLNIIDEVMNNREIDSIRNAILAIRDKVKELEEVQEVGEVSKDGTITIEEPVFVRIRLRGNNALCITSPYWDGAKYVCIDAHGKIDTGIYGAMWYE